MQQLRYRDILIGGSEYVLELCGWAISRHRWLIELRVLFSGHVLRHRIERMHELRCRQVFGCVVFIVHLMRHRQVFRRRSERVYQLQYRDVPRHTELIELHWLRGR